MNISPINNYSQSLKDQLIEYRMKKIHFSLKYQRNSMTRGNVVARTCRCAQVSCADVYRAKMSCADTSARKRRRGNVMRGSVVSR